MNTTAEHAPIFIADCELGRGLFAARAFAAGETILRFTGPLINLAQSIAKGETEGNPLQVGPLDYIDLEPPGVFGNHSCEPNAGIRDDVVLVALRPLVAGEEIRFDYSTTMWEDVASGGAGACPAAVEQARAVPSSPTFRRCRQRCGRAIWRWASCSALSSNGR